MKIDCFLRVAPQNWVRGGMALACVAAWKQMPEANLRIICAERVNPTFACTVVNMKEIEKWLPLGKGKMATFQWTSRQYADEHAETEPYLLCDDDRIPMGTDWVKKAVAYWEEYNADHKYVMMCDRSALWMEDPCQGRDFLNMDMPIAETSDWWFGPNYLSYKGAIPYREFEGWPAATQDPDLGRWAKDHGKKQAVMVNVVSNHMGVGWSQVQPELYGRY
jgi:hypothetical protein